MGYLSGADCCMREPPRQRSAWWRTTRAKYPHNYRDNRHGPRPHHPLSSRCASLSARPVPASLRPVPPRPAPLPPSEGIKLRTEVNGPGQSGTSGAWAGGSAARRRECRAMASEELAQKLQRRLQLEESGVAAEGEVEAVKDAAVAGEVEERSCLTASAGAELSAKLCRRQDINEGAAQPRLAAVFNPYTEFKEFSRRQIKDMERMFRL